MIIKEFLIKEIGRYANPIPLNDKERDRRRSNIAKAIESKTALSNWSLFYNGLIQKKNIAPDIQINRYRKLNAKQSKALLEVLEISYKIEKEHINVYTYTERKSKEHKYGVAVYRVDNELYDSDFRLIKIKDIIKAVPLSECYKSLDEVE